MADIITYPSKSTDGTPETYTVDFKLGCVMAIHVVATSAAEAHEAAEKIGLEVWDQLEKLKTDPRADVGFDDLEHLHTWSEDGADSMEEETAA